MNWSFLSSSRWSRWFISSALIFFQNIWPTSWWSTEIDWSNFDQSIFSSAKAPVASRRLLHAPAPTQNSHRMRTKTQRIKNWKPPNISNSHFLGGFLAQANTLERYTICSIKKQCLLSPNNFLSDWDLEKCLNKKLRETSKVKVVASTKKYQVQLCMVIVDVFSSNVI